MLLPFHLQCLRCTRSTLQHNQPLAGTVAPGGYAFYSLELPAGASAHIVLTLLTARGTLLLSEVTQVPTLTKAKDDDASIVVASPQTSGASNDWVPVLNVAASDEARTLYIAVHGSALAAQGPGNAGNGTVVDSNSTSSGASKLAVVQYTVLAHVNGEGGEILGESFDSLVMGQPQHDVLDTRQANLAAGR
jgi:hypothetical protein